MFHWAYSVASPLLVYDDNTLVAQLSSSEGVRQGDPFAAFVFAFLMQPAYTAAIADLPDCHAVSIQDDLTLIGPQQQVFAAFDKLVQLAPSFHLTLRMDKCAVFIPESVSEADRAVVQSACNSSSPSAPRALVHSDSMESLGVMFGGDSAVHAHCMKSLARHEEFLASLTHEEMPVQTALLLLRFCAVPRFSYLARTTPPALFAEAAARFDSMLWACFTRLIGSTAESIPLEVQQQAQLPLSRGGMGLRPVLPLAATAYFSSLASALSDFIAEFQGSQAGVVGSSSRGSCSEWIQQTQIVRQLQECWSIMQVQGIQQLHSPSNNKKHRVGAAPSTPAAATVAAALNNPVNSVASLPARSHPSLPVFNSTAASSSSSSSSFSSSASSPLSGPAAVSHLCLRAVAHSRLLLASRSSPATNPTPAAFLHAEHLQSAATQQREEVNRVAIIKAAEPRRRALITAASVPNSTSFLSTLPTVAAYTLEDESMIQAVRHRLGLSAADSLATQTYVCGTLFATDPDHYHSCVALRSNSLTKRHDAIVMTLDGLAREAGWSVTVEPNAHLRPVAAATGSTATVSAAALDCPALSCSDDHWNRHGDLLLVRHGKKLYIDVSCTRPTNASSLQYHSAVTHSPLVSTIVRGEQKKRKYAAIAAANDYELLPFVCETYGGMGDDAIRVLRYLSAHAAGFTQKEFLRHAHSSLSIALQRGNATVALIGQQQLNMRRQREHKAMGDAIQRARHYGQLGNIQQLKHFLQPDISAVLAAGTSEQAHSHSYSSHDHCSSSSLFFPPPPFVHSTLALSADLPPPSCSCSDEQQLRGDLNFPSSHSHSLSHFHFPPLSPHLIAA